MRVRLNTRLRLLRRNFQRFLSRKISNRLMFTYVALGGLPLIIVSVILISLTQTTVQSYIYQINKETARRASNQIYLFIQDPLTILQTTALTRDIYEMDVFSQSSLINRLKDRNLIFNKIFVLDDSGRVVVTTDFGEEKRDFSNQPFFQTGIQGQEYFSDVYFSPSRFPLITIAEPIIRYNQQLGVLAAEIDLRRIWALVDSITIGDTGFAFLLSADGQVIAHRNKDKVYNREDYSQYDFYHALKLGEQNMISSNVDGEEHILVYSSVPVLGWSVIVEQSHAEAFKLARRMQVNVIYVIAITIIVAIILGVLGIRRFTKPLLQLVKGVREYGRGNLEHKIDMPTNDELAELATEFNTMAASLKDNQKELQRMERLAALSKFAALVSHEVRNPLNSMNINMQILKRAIHRPDLEPERKTKYLDVISSEINRINELVTNFLSIARPPELNLIRTDIHTVLEEVVLLQKAQAEVDDVVIKTQFTRKPLAGMFDYNQLKQVFHNITINAIEAIEDSGTLWIKTRIKKKVIHEENRYFALLEFKDDGEGIPKEILNDVFEFYHTTKRTGSGLGLAIAKQIIEGHKGNIYIKSKVNVGTSVFIELPIDILPGIETNNIEKPSQTNTINPE